MVPGIPLPLRHGPGPGRHRPRRLLATSWEGRPVKVEGNPSHPVTHGSTGPHTQAELASLYNPSAPGC